MARFVNDQAVLRRGDGPFRPFGGAPTLRGLLFPASEPGFTFEPWDITTLYQDRAGTTPVTAAGQSVGYRRDKSGRGNHQVAVSDAKRGVYGWMPKTGKRNLLTYTEQFDNAAWLKSAATATASVEIDPTGGASAFRAQLEASASAYIYQANITSIPNGQNYTISMWVRSNTGVAQTFRLFGDGTLDNSADLTATSYWQRFTFSAVSSGGTSCGIRANSANGAADILIWGAQLELGSTATAYQRVVSQYDITEAGVPTCYYVQADGVDDAYVTPTITPNTDKVQVFAGVRKLSETGVGTFVEFSTAGDVNNGAFYLRAPWEGVASYDWNSQGTLNSRVGSSGQTAPITNVITGLGDISGDTATLRINGTQVAQSTIDQGTGNYLAYPAYIYSRGGTSLPFNGLDFGHAVRFGPNLDAATIARVESLIARNTPEVDFLFGGVWTDQYNWDDETNWNDGA